MMDGPIMDMPMRNNSEGAAPVLLDLRGLKRQFMLGRTVVQALRGIDLRIGRGEFVAVWGPSGSGKSTLMNAIGLIDRPDAGQVVLDGQDITKLNDNALTDYRAKHIGFVFQSFNLVPVLSALENVMLPLEIRGQGGKVAKAHAAALLAEVGLGDFLAFRPDRLSGGQRQRVAIARALVGDPDLVVADEPTANLDSENGRLVLDLMLAMNQAKGVTFVFTTHDPRLLNRVRRRIQLRDGLISSDETGPADITLGEPAVTPAQGASA
jgi:putative ABC transport system ATP-binding protein